MVILVLTREPPAKHNASINMNLAVHCLSFLVLIKKNHHLSDYLWCKGSHKKSQEGGKELRVEERKGRVGGNGGGGKGLGGDRGGGEGGREGWRRNEGGRTTNIGEAIVPH